MSAPLAHLKILDFSTLLPGPFATMMLADLGADVVRVEAPGRPDLTRQLPPLDEYGIASGHAFLNRNKRSIAIDLKQPGAAELVRRLVRDGGHDIVVEQFRPGVMDRLGVGFESLRSVCPQLIYCSLTGYGQTGPYRDRAGHDINYLALSGMLSHYGRRGGGPPPPLPVQVADVGAGGLHLVAGLLSAVIRRTQTGEGACVDISMLDGSLAWNGLAAAHAIVTDTDPGPEDLLLNGGSFYDLYETSDGRLLSVGPLEEKFWSEFCNAIGRPDLIAERPDFAATQPPHLKDEIRRTILARPFSEWCAVFAARDVCVEPVLTVREALAQPQTNARSMVAEVPHTDGRTQPQIASPIRLSDHTPEYRSTGVAAGMHTQEILHAAGFTEAELTALLAFGTVSVPPR